MEIRSDIDSSACFFHIFLNIIFCFAWKSTGILQAEKKFFPCTEPKTRSRVVPGTSDSMARCSQESIKRVDFPTFGRPIIVTGVPKEKERKWSFTIPLLFYHWGDNKTMVSLKIKYQKKLMMNIFLLKQIDVFWGILYLEEASAHYFRITKCLPEEETSQWRRNFEEKTGDVLFCRYFGSVHREWIAQKMMRKPSGMNVVLFLCNIFERGATRQHTFLRPKLFSQWGQRNYRIHCVEEIPWWRFMPVKRFLLGVPTGRIGRIFFCNSIAMEKHLRNRHQWLQKICIWHFTRHFFRISVTNAGCRFGR